MHAPHGIALSPCRRFRCRTFEELVRWSNALSLSFSPPPVTEAQLGLAEYGGVFDEYLELVVQFGYVTLFAAALPMVRVRVRVRVGLTSAPSTPSAAEAGPCSAPPSCG